MVTKKKKSVPVIFEPSCIKEQESMKHDATECRTVRQSIICAAFDDAQLTTYNASP